MGPRDGSKRGDRDGRAGRKRTAGGTSRRALVAALGTAALAGCSALGGSDNFREFEERLRASSVDVKRISEDFRRWIVEYFPRRQSESAFRAEVETIGTVYAETVPSESENPNHTSLKCILFDEQRTRTGSYEVQAEWARAYASGELSETEYLDRVRSALER